MDPNEALRRFREAYARWEAVSADLSGPALAVGDEMRDTGEALDQWLSRKGFLPDAWER